MEENEMGVMKLEIGVKIGVIKIGVRLSSWQVATRK